MNNEGLTSVAVVDNGLNVVGNISTADVQHLTNAANTQLLKLPCMHFISVILSERGVERGRDSFPVFYVTPKTTLTLTIAKLVATNSHRMWITEPTGTPSPSAPATPRLEPTTPLLTSQPPPPVSAVGGASSPPAVLVPPSSTSPNPVSAVPASALSGSNLSGRLVGVVSLTDILNLFARSVGLPIVSPSEQRARRRRSSSLSVRPSFDNGRSSMDSRR